jgi:putative nucleotidyltransferase with HDIG domain
MRLINISEYDNNNMVLAKPIYDSRKRILLTAGRTVDPKIKARLEGMGINFLFVEDEVSKGIDIEDMLDMPTWTDLVQAVNTFHEQVKKGTTPDLKEIQQVASKLIDEINARPTLILIPSGAIAKELQPFAHAVNVTILSLLTGKKMGYNNLKQRDLAMGALLHDIGKEMTEEYEKHPESGFNFLRKINQFSTISAHIAYQHHETIDGKGFPRQITGEDMLEIAQICAVANIYDNLTTQKKLPPHEAMEGVMATADILYDHKVVQAFSQAVPTYPPGTKVIVDNKEPSIVTRIEKHLQRPIVKILSKGKEIDLSEFPTLMIKPE